MVELKFNFQNYEILLQTATFCSDFGLSGLTKGETSENNNKQKVFHRSHFLKFSVKI